MCGLPFPITQVRIVPELYHATECPKGETVTGTNVQKERGSAFVMGARSRESSCTCTFAAFTRNRDDKQTKAWRVASSGTGRDPLGRIVVLSIPVGTSRTKEFSVLDS